MDAETRWMENQYVINYTPYSAQMLVLINSVIEYDARCV
jgi:hypothetical protein